MSKYPHRVLRTSVAAAGMAALSLSFVGTAAAATPHGSDLPDAPDAGHALDGHAPETPSLPDAGGVLSGHNPLVDNELATFELPRVETVAYETPSVPVHTVSHADSHDGDDADSGGGTCHGLGGSHNLPFHNNLGASCADDGNSIAGGGVPVHTIAAKHIDGPSGLYSHTPDAGDLSQSDPSLPVVSDLPVHLPSLGGANGYHVATNQV